MRGGERVNATTTTTMTTTTRRRRRRRTTTRGTRSRTASGGMGRYERG